MLPALKTDRLQLADVLPSCLEALAGAANPLNLPRVGKAVVLLVDGLGTAALRARAGHARVLTGASGVGSSIESGFPTTTASALGTLMTGVSPGEHGLVGYTALDPVNGRVVNQLSGWGEGIDPAAWQLAPTVFERATQSGVRSIAIGPERYRYSGFTAAVLRGAEYRAGVAIADRLDTAALALREAGPALIYVYAPELDMAAHANGWESRAWTEALENLDSALGTFVRGLGRRDGLLVTADHGVMDIPVESHVLIDAVPGLVDDIRFVAGDPRCLQLHFEPDLTPAERDAIVERWRESESARAWVLTREEAVAAGWFGTVRPEVLPRIGDLLVAARKNIVYYDSRSATTTGRAMIGQHGSWSPAELQVPLLRYGAFAGR